jgi:hypothetical protein
MAGMAVRPNDIHARSTLHMNLNASRPLSLINRCRHSRGYPLVL